MRGHSNVQGQRTVGIAEKTKLVPLDKLKELFGFDPPTKDGMNIVEAVEGLFDGSVKAFVSLGGNLVRAVPDQGRMEQAWAAQELTVMVSTKLNRSHLFPGKQAYILPCLGRFEDDEQASGNQTVTTEDSFSMINASIGDRDAGVGHGQERTGDRRRASPRRRCRRSPQLKWDEWTGDYGLVRDLIEADLSRTISATTTRGCTRPAVSIAATARTNGSGRRRRARRCSRRRASSIRWASRMRRAAIG